MDSIIQEPSFPNKIGDICLESKLTQKFRIPIVFEGDEYAIIVGYEYERAEVEDKKVLSIGVPDLFISALDKQGVYAEFTEYKPYAHDNYNITVVKSSEDGCHNSDVAEFFFKEIQPILEEKLPVYMKDLINLGN